MASEILITNHAFLLTMNDALVMTSYKAVSLTWELCSTSFCLKQHSENSRYSTVVCLEKKMIIWFKYFSGDLLICMLKCRKLCFSDRVQGRQLRDHLLSYSTNPHFSIFQKFTLCFWLHLIPVKLCRTFIILSPNCPFACRCCSVRLRKK